MQSLPIPERGLLIHDAVRPASVNMAIDEVLLEDAAQHGVLTLRFYGWSEASVSLGYFQRLADRDSHAASSHCPLVRRASGGGAIVHDRPDVDLTYSVSFPALPRQSSCQLALYQTFHETMVELLRDRGAGAEQCAEPRVKPPGSQPKPFLCFQRHTLGDVLMAEDKVMGSAQRRFADAVLQHGTLLLDRSPAAPELPGVAQLAQGGWTAADLTADWLRRLERRWSIQWQASTLSQDQWRRAEEKVRVKYAHFSWNGRR